MYFEGDDDANRIEGTTEDDTIVGYGGDDTLLGMRGNDQLYGDVGDDRVFGGRGDDYIADYDGSNWLDGGAGSDTISTSGDVTARGGGGDDAINGGSGVSLFEGGKGDDWLSVSYAAEATLSGGAGRDLITAVGGLLHIDGGLGDDQVWADELTVATIKGGSGNDAVNVSLFYPDGADVRLDGGEGRDRFGLTVYSSALVDIDLSASMADNIRLGQFGVTLGNFESGLLVLYAENARINVGDLDIDLITGSASGGGDELIGGRAGTSFLSGGYDDIITAGAGADSLDGGGGNDMLNGGAGSDTAIFRTNSWLKVDLNIDGAQDTGLGVDTLSSIENLIGGGGSDRLTGDEGDNRLQDDVDDSSDGADNLAGGVGDDVLVAQLGGQGDQLTGGAGSDTFAFTHSLNYDQIAVDQITDLESIDVIDLSALDADRFSEGDQQFVLVDALSGQIGEAALDYNSKTGRTFLLLDTDGDGEANFIIRMDGDHQAFDNLIL